MIIYIDTECFPGYWLLTTLDETGDVQHFDTYEGKKLDVALVRRRLRGHTLISFNGVRYDIPMLSLALNGAECDQLKTASDDLIVREMRQWQFEQAHKVKPVKVDHIDLIEVAPGMVSLKSYGGRMHAPNLQDLPIDPATPVTASMRPIVRQYCLNDVRTTKMLHERLKPQIELRERMGAEYGIDLRSKSDAQIAEAVITHEVALLRGEPVDKPEVKARSFKYQVPDYLIYRTQALNSLLEDVASTKFRTDSAGVVKMPDNLADRKITIGNSQYRLGIGGLHSSESCVHHRADERTLLIDRDVESYYPSLILTNGMYPEQMGQEFLNVYRSIVERRLTAKHNKDKVTADSLKICVNGSFGKLGSPYSMLYAPHLLIQVTVTGQLALLMLIEMLEESGIPVVSANTDGIVIKCPVDKVPVMDDCVAGWEIVTGLKTEATEYAAIYNRDVNNYIAVKKDGGVKTKGVFAACGLQKSPVNEVVVDAALAYISDQTPVDLTIRNCHDITRFLTLRSVRGGAVDAEGNHLGRVVRWYYSTDVMGDIRYASNGNRVPRSEGAQPIMQLPLTLPNDIDYHWYTREAYSVLQGFGLRVAPSRHNDLLEGVT